ncbi:major facilitator superfamily domain-containing protein [Dactylonectria macrodidyma]|uniref:Major facilitator superfamily domain-containing protein n=1 Tax=Dactylonectria macrodidyma TaxID=307937 RepID=A0A9P9FEW2_9HYPO|nr:major facilitator superfamily domain-containing protein [Dactylonectria macrodidyma]
MAPTKEKFNDPAWPPGTVQLKEEDRSDVTILQPQPTRDPNDPLNWPKGLKYLNFGLATFYSMMVFAFIDVATPTWGPTHEELGFSYDMLNNSYAAGCGALAIGAVVLIPFALKYGRRPVYIFSTAIQMGVSIWSARQQTVADLMLVNIISCFVGALAEVVVQMTVADVFFVNQRGTMNSLFFWSTRIGASLAPMAAGYSTVSQGWRWVWWWVAIFFGLLLVAMIFLYEETKFVPSMIEGVGLSHDTNTNVADDKGKKDLELARTTSDAGAKLTATSIDPTIPRKTYKQRLALTTSSPGSLHFLFRHCYQPFQILVSVPGVFYMSLVYGGMMVASNVIVTTVSNWMTRAPYNFDASQIGLMSLAPFIGSTLGTLICGPFSDWLILFLAKRNKGIYEPEMRLWVMTAFAPFVPIGMVLFGVGLNNGWPWPILAIGYGMCSFGTAPAGTIALTYITDAYTEIVGDAMVGVTFTRNMCSTMFIFALPPWIAAAGLQSVYITMGVLISTILFGSGIFIAFGKTFRFRFRKTYRHFATKQFEPRVL